MQAICGRHRRIWWGLIATAVIASPQANAHDFWLQAERFRLQPGEIADISPMVGHGPDRRRWAADPRRIVELRSVGPAGLVDYFPAGVPVRSGQSIRLAFQPAGVHVLGLATDHARSELPSDRFAHYLEEEGMDAALAERRHRGEDERPGREIYSRCAKVILQVANTGQVGASTTRQLGLKLEIAPERDPRQPDGRAVPLRVYYEGKPLAGALVKLWRLDAYGGPYMTQRTDGMGRVLMPSPQPGVWQFNVVWTKRLEGHAWADFDTTFSSLPSTSPRFEPALKTHLFGQPRNERRLA